MYRIKKSNHDLVDVMLSSEYYASLCGFEYPISSLNDIQTAGQIELSEKNIGPLDKEENKQGLMVWHNQVYRPEIKIEKINKDIWISLLNERELPYPVIQRVKAWIFGLHYYLSELDTKENSKRVEETAIKQYTDGLRETLR